MIAWFSREGCPVNEEVFDINLKAGRAKFIRSSPCKGCNSGAHFCDGCDGKSQRRSAYAYTQEKIGLLNGDLQSKRASALNEGALIQSTTTAIHSVSAQTQSVRSHLTESASASDLVSVTSVEESGSLSFSSELDSEIDFDAWAEDNRDIVKFVVSKVTESPFYISLKKRIREKSPLSDRQIEAVRRDMKPVSKSAPLPNSHLGEIGQIISIELTVIDQIPVVAKKDGLGRFRFKCKTNAGQSIVYFGSEESMPAVGSSEVMRIVVKEHREWKGKLHTLIDIIPSA